MNNFNRLLEQFFESTSTLTPIEVDFLKELEYLNPHGLAFKMTDKGEKKTANKLIKMGLVRKGTLPERNSPRGYFLTNEGEDYLNS